MTRFAVIPVVLLAATLAAGGPPVGADEVPAEIQALRDVRVPAEVSGRVLLRPENESAAVKRGEVVVTLDNVLLGAVARAARASARRAKARHEWAQIELKRVEGLFERQSVGQADVDAALVAAREAEANLAAAEATAKEMETRLERARIVAPFDGKLVRVYPQAGEYMRVGETAFRIIDDSSLKVILYVSARQLPRVKTGTKLSVESDVEGLELPVLNGKVFSVAPAAEGKSRTFRVEVRAIDKSGRWRPGMTGRVRFGP